MIRVVAIASLCLSVTFVIAKDDYKCGNWWLGNQQMELALKFKKYDYKVAWGDGGHTGKHGGSIMPESLRWLWRADESDDAGGKFRGGVLGVGA